MLVIDDYYSAVGVDREPILESIKKWPRSCGEEGWEAIDRTAELLEVARAHDVPIIYFHATENFPSLWGGIPQLPPKIPGLPAEIVAKSNEIVAEVAPRPGDLVIQKADPSGFYRTPLHDHLTSLGVDTLLVAGESTSGCVRATVVDGSARGYRIGVVEECVFDRTQVSHAISLLDMHTKFADVVSLAFATEYLGTTRSR